MTYDDTKATQGSYRVRFAEPSDGEQISALYTHTYTPLGGGTAHDHYPFPQIMEKDNVVELITGDRVIWVVAEPVDGAIVGSAAAVRNIGGLEDHLAEVFGVAVNENYRRQGIASLLLKGLLSALTGNADFILCEARTAEAGGWKAARNAGLHFVGFEPYAHAMPIGFESMVPTAVWTWNQWSPASDMQLRNTGSSVSLAYGVHSSVTSSPTRDSGLEETPPPPRMPIIERTIGSRVNVRRDDRSGREWFASSQGGFDRHFCIVELCPLYGEEPNSERFQHLYYVASRDDIDIGAAWVFYDKTDARARILGLRGMSCDVEHQFLRAIVENLLQVYGNGALVIVVCVRADTLEIQIDLEAMDFSPTAYFPAMIATADGRTDVIQYTRLVQRSWSESMASVTALECPEARTLIEQVLKSRVGERTSHGDGSA